MSRTVKGGKGPGYDYGAKRIGNNGWCSCPGKGIKRITHSKERMQAKRIIRDEQSSTN